MARTFEYSSELVAVDTNRDSVRNQLSTRVSGEVQMWQMMAKRASDGAGFGDVALERVVFCGVALPADVLAASFDILFVGNDLVDGVLSEY